MRAPLNSLAPASRARYVLEGSAWAAAYGVAIGFLWYGALVAGPYLRSLG
ncbi:hypothetical protein [Burkholderia orbicola]